VIEMPQLELSVPPARGCSWERMTVIRTFHTLAALVVTFVAAAPALAQYDACGDTLGLYSPASLDLEFIAGAVEGVKITWDSVPDSVANCHRLVVDDDLRNRVNPLITGSYANRFDQDISFTVVDSGLVGTTNQDRVQISLATTPPAGVAAPPISGIFNLSNRGGFYRLDIASTSDATQSNDGVPDHLPTTDITALATWTGSGGSSRIYAAIAGVPLVRSDNGGADWLEPAIGGQDPIGFPIEKLAVDPNDAEVVFAGTRKAGIWRSQDGGQTFERLYPTGIVNPSQSQRISALNFVTLDVGGQSETRLMVNIGAVGLFYSVDQGNSFTRLLQPLISIDDISDTNSCPESDNPIPAQPVAFAVSPNDPGLMYAGFETFGVLWTSDGGLSWSDPEPFFADCGKSTTIIDLVVVPDTNTGEDLVIATTVRRGVVISIDTAPGWAPSPDTNVPPDPLTGTPVAFSWLTVDPNNSDIIYAVAAENGLFWTTTQGVFGFDPYVYGSSAIPTPRLGSIIINPSDPGELLVGTIGAGVYEPGDTIDLSRTVAKPTGSFAGFDTSLGLLAAFDAGVLDDGEGFNVLVQTFQGYAVWRSTRLIAGSQEPSWELIGLYDRTNPESCIQGRCSDPSPTPIEGCFSEKRAACFSFNDDGTAEFFDPDVFPGFNYNYAVSSFDYTFLGNTSPSAFDGEMLFSPRSDFESTPEALFFIGLTPPGSNVNHNRTSFQVNPEVRENLDNVYVAPNPLRRQAGWDDTGESSVRFFNVAGTATCQIFTLAGDLVRTLRNTQSDSVERGIIRWDTKNEAGEDVASGVYIYRITTAKGDEKMDHFTIIR